MQKFFLSLPLIFLLTILQSQAQMSLVGGLSSDIYASKYIVDDNLSDVDLNDYHKIGVTWSPKILIGPDLSNRVRVLVGIGRFTRLDVFDFRSAPTSYTLEPGKVIYKNQYQVIPMMILFNLLKKDSKSRMPIGLGVDFTTFKQTKITSEKLTMIGGYQIPATLKYDDVNNYMDESLTALNFQMGYGYQFTDNLGLDATLFLRYDMKDFNTNYDLYDRYAFAGINLMLMYKFFKQE